MKKIEWYCPRCKRFVENPEPSGMKGLTGIPFITSGSVPGQMNCDVCGHVLMELSEEKRIKR